MKKQFDEVLLWLGVNSSVYSFISLFIATIIVLWDFFVGGLRGFFEWNIGWLGMLGLLISLALMWLARYIDNEFRVE